jgi:hypothetical protein
MWVEYFDESTNEYYPLTDKIIMTNVAHRFEAVKVPLIS